jgi:hypothetical protein
MPVPPCLQFDQQHMLSRFFSLLFSLPTAAFSTIMAKRKATAEELEAQAKSNGYKRETHREKDSTRDNGKHNNSAFSESSHQESYALQPSKNVAYAIPY